MPNRPLHKPLDTHGRPVNARVPRTAPLVLAAILAAALGGETGCQSPFQRSSLAQTLSDSEFWALAERLSEPPGAFTHSDNLVSNEPLVAETVRTLREAGGVYIGVGPEQNFTYMAAVRPSMAFIVDVRAENRALHLLYKALFEIAANRADFVSRLFSRAPPAGASADSSIDALFARAAGADPQARLRAETSRLVRDCLLQRHRFALAPRDLAWIDYALDAFYSDGPDIHYARLRPYDPRGPSYRALMTARNVAGAAPSYLATDERFAFVKNLQAKNLVVPVVGDFGGPDALRLIGEYLMQHRATVSAFYGSNVEVYLNRAQGAAFCRNLLGLPHGSSAWFIGSKGKQPLRTRLAACEQTGVAARRPATSPPEQRLQ